MKIFFGWVSSVICFLGIVLLLPVFLDGSALIFSWIDIELPWYDAHPQAWVNKTWSFINEHTQISIPESWYTDWEGTFACLIFAFIFTRVKIFCNWMTPSE
jgi:hypothetical protein